VRIRGCRRRPFSLVEFTTEQIADAMDLAGIDPAMIHAFRKTGFIPTTETWELFTPEERQAWESALAEYDAKSARSATAAKGAG
jgi:hypothetical protein